MSYVFDTNALSALVHQRKGFRNLAAIIDGTPVLDRLISAITMSELETMIAKAAEPASKAEKVRLILAHFNIIDFGEVAAAYAGRVRAYLEPRGEAIGPLDTLIAAHALSVNATVVTDDVREFSRVPGLRVEGWR